MRVKVSADELYPHYSICEDHADFECELTEAEIERIKACQAEFKAVQDLIESKVHTKVEPTEAEKNETEVFNTILEEGMKHILSRK